MNTRSFKKYTNKSNLNALLLITLSLNLYQPIYRVKLPDSRKISEGLRNLIMSMLEKDPKKRVTIQGLRENEWLNEGCKTSLN